MVSLSELNELLADKDLLGIPAAGTTARTRFSPSGVVDIFYTRIAAENDRAFFRSRRKPWHPLPRNRADSDYREVLLTRNNGAGGKDTMVRQRDRKNRIPVSERFSLGTSTARAGRFQDMEISPQFGFLFGLLWTIFFPLLRRSGLSGRNPCRPQQLAGLFTVNFDSEVLRRLLSFTSIKRFRLSIYWLR